MAQNWGFVVYRTAYGKDEEWEEAKARILAAKEEDEDEILSNRGNPETATLLFVEDEATLSGKTPAEVRRIFNPSYDPTNPEAAPPALRPDGLCAHAFLVADQEAITSILEGTDDDMGYVLAVDATTETSAQFEVVEVEGGENQMRPVAWDGTMKVQIDDILGSFYLRAIGNQTLTMGEIHPEIGEVWMPL